MSESGDDGIFLTDEPNLCTRMGCSVYENEWIRQAQELKKQKGHKMSDDEILEQIRPIMECMLGVDSSEITLDANLADDLGADSSGRTLTAMEIEKFFGFSSPAFDDKDMRTVGDVVRAIKRLRFPQESSGTEKPGASKSVFAILTNLPNDSEKPTQLNLGGVSNQAKQNFLNRVWAHDPKNYNGNSNSCRFRLYYDQTAVYVSPCGVDVLPRHKHTAQKNAENEMVIEILPLSKKSCGSWVNYHCPTCIASGGCTSPLVKELVGKFLFPKKYGRSR